MLGIIADNSIDFAPGFGIFSRLPLAAGKIGVARGALGRA